MGEIRGRVSFPHAHHHTLAEGGGTSYALLLHSELAPPCLCLQGQLYYDARKSDAAAEGLGLVPHLLQVMRAEERHLSLTTWQV